MEIFSNLDLLTVAFSIAGTFVLGFSVYLSDRGNETNRVFFRFSIVTGAWGLLNYTSYKLWSLDLTLWSLRLVLFLAVWQAFFTFAFCYVFPRAHVYYPPWYRFFLIPLVTVVSLLTLTPLMFESFRSGASLLAVPIPLAGAGMPLFGIVSVLLVLSGLIILLRTTHRAPRAERARYQFIWAGAVLMFALIIGFNFVLPAAFAEVRFIPLGALFTFPFVLFTSYAILHYRLFNVKVVATSLLVFLLSVVTFLEIIFVRDIAHLLFRGSVFLLILTFGILLIQNVIKEVRQREKIERQEKELEAANARLRELDKQKTEFVSFASHQLRAPLTALKGYASLLLEGSYGKLEPQIAEAIGKMGESSRNMALVVEDFLNVSRIEIGMMKYYKKPFDFCALVTDAGKELRLVAEQKNLSFTVTCPPEPVTVEGDTGKLKQVLTNLIDNAIKYTPQGKVAVKLAADRARRIAVFSVTDSGVGIPVGSLAKLFDKFVRGGNANSTNTQGTGLGLYVAKQFVEAHGGRIWAESKGEGHGSAFFVELPLAGQALAA